MPFEYVPSGVFLGGECLGTIKYEEPVNPDEAFQVLMKLSVPNLKRIKLFDYDEPAGPNGRRSPVPIKEVIKKYLTNDQIIEFNDRIHKHTNKTLAIFGIPGQTKSARTGAETAARTVE